MSKLNDILGQRAKIAKEAQTIYELADSEERELSAEEITKTDALMDAVDVMQGDVDKATADEERRNNLDAIMAGLEGTGDEPDKPDTEEVEAEGDIVRRALGSYFTRGPHTPASDLRALAMDPDVAGGFTVLPEMFVNELIQAVDNRVLIRQLATVFPVTDAASLGVPSLDNDPADPTWTAEILTGDEDSDMDFGKRALAPQPLAQRIKVSKKLLRATSISIDALVRERLAYKAAVVEENAFLTGSGSNQPLGVFTASANGISTSRDVSTGNTATALKADNLIEVKYSLKDQYTATARWIFNRAIIKVIRKLKDGEGNYIWRAGLATDRPDTILDLPFLSSEYAPSTLTTGLYVGILGDFSLYWIADALNMEIQVLTELYAATNQNGYILRKETDGMPVLEEAFARVTMA